MSAKRDNRVAYLWRSIINLEVQLFQQLSEIIKCEKEVASHVKMRKYLIKFNYSTFVIRLIYSAKVLNMNQTIISLNTKSQEETINNPKRVVWECRGNLTNKP